MKVYLFAYGKLKREYSPPKTAKDITKDYIHGYLFDRKDHGGDDAALVRAGSLDAPLVEGERMAIAKDELYELDKEETGYQRELVTTNHGYPAWVYVWQGHVPSHAKLLSVWHDYHYEKRKL